MISPAVTESDFGGNCGGVAPFRILGIHVYHCEVSIVMLLKVLFFKWGHWSITVTGSFIGGVGGRILLGGADFLWWRLGGGWG